MGRTLSKSKLIAYRQCPKRLWLEIHRPELRDDSKGALARFDVGHQIGDIARQIYDREDRGILIDIQAIGFSKALDEAALHLAGNRPIFEAGFVAEHAMAFADVMLPQHTADSTPQWRMIEVKSSSSVKDYHRDDAAIQAFVARAAGVSLTSIALAHVDSSWVYPGGDNYDGLLKEEDLSAEAFARDEEVKRWIADAQTVAERSSAPERQTGTHCSKPFECGFMSHCLSQEPQAEAPVQWLPRIQSKALRRLVEDKTCIEMADVPDELLNERQRRVKWHTLSGTTFFDSESAAAELAAHELPACFLDFETINWTIPIWAGCRPFQQIPFQFSAHQLSERGHLDHRSFLDLSGNDPSLPFVKALLEYCGSEGPIYVYNAGFESARIRELAGRFSSYAAALRQLNARIVDLLPIAQKHYYHPSQKGSWSIKKVLPAIAPELQYDDLIGVQDGGMAMDAYSEAISTRTTPERRDEIRKQLLAYCGLDTLAMVRLWQFFSGRNDLDISYAQAT